jgi:glycosyltransferase involved in cell wall biosynthesis
MHILFVGFVWPEPKSSAAGQNIVSYIQSALQNNWKVSFCSAAQVTLQTHDLANMGVNSFTIALNCASFNEQVSTLKPDVVIFDRYLSYEQFAWRVKESLPSALLVLDAEDLHCLRSARHNLLKQQVQRTKQADNSNEDLKNTHEAGSFMSSEDILKTANISLLCNDIAIREIACILQADLTLVLSDFEKKILVDNFKVPREQVQYLPFILNNTALAQLDKNESYENKQDFVFIGNFRHLPNYHAVRILAEQCWPHIYKSLRERHPAISCHVFGAYMPAKVKQLENKKTGFKVHGYAQDQYRVIQKARVMLAPISFGAGVKGKLLDAMLCDTPSITSPLGQEGISAMPWPGEVVTSIDAFIKAAVTLYTQEQSWLKCRQRGRKILAQEYDADKNHWAFTAIIESKLKNLTQNRQHNFLQRLLNHHQFQTSKYMSQWIEAKNK